MTIFQAGILLIAASLVGGVVAGFFVRGRVPLARLVTLGLCGVVLGAALMICSVVLYFARFLP